MTTETKTIEHRAFPKISRLNRTIYITEKIDGANAAIGITDDGEIYAQSRNRIVTPTDDNFGFARWVMANKEALLLLGPGLHFGEWWGAGIQRGYGLNEKRFSLFDVHRWTGFGAPVIEEIRAKGVTNLYVIPQLYVGAWTTGTIQTAQVFMPDLVLAQLRAKGSTAAPGYMNPEGIVIFHKASGTMSKATLEGDAEYKGGVRDKDGNVVPATT